MAKRSRISADKATEEILRFIENSDCEADIENDEDLANNHLTLFNRNEGIFIYKEKYTESKMEEGNQQGK